MNLIRIKNYCVSRDTMKKEKRQLIEWGKIFENYISEKGLASRIHKEHWKY